MQDLKVGFLGTGLMGLPMAQRLLEQGRSIIAYNRTASKLEPLQTLGAAIALSPEAAVKESTCLIVMLTDASAIETTLLSGNTRLALEGRTVIQMGTIGPEESQAIARDVMDAGGEYVECPVLGSIPEATRGELILMMGATPEQFERWSPLLKTFGPSPRLIGPVGTASALKLAMNQLIASLTAAFSLSLGLVQHYHVDPEIFMEILRGSALYAPTFDKKLGRMGDRQFANPNFPTKHLLKDTDLFLAAAHQAGLQVPALEGVRQLLAIACEKGFSDGDYASLFSVVNPPS